MTALGNMLTIDSETDPARALRELEVNIQTLTPDDKYHIYKAAALSSAAMLVDLQDDIGCLQSERADIEDSLAYAEGLLEETRADLAQVNAELNETSLALEQANYTIERMTT